MRKRSYSEDEFDQLAEERVAVGAHLKAGKKSKTWLAVLLIAILAPSAGWAFVQLGGAETVQKLQSHEATPQTEETPSEGEEVASSDEEVPVQAEKEPAPTPNMDTEVRVLNGTNTTGLAAKKQEVLTGKGFTKVTADNYQGGSSPTVSTVYYAKDEDKVTANEVASSLDISEVKLEPSAVAGQQGIVVVLRS